MLSLRKISFLVGQHGKGELSAHQIFKLAKVSKSTFYRHIKQFAGLSYYLIRKKLMQMKPPGRPAKHISIGLVQAVIQKRIETKANDKVIAKLLEAQGVKISHCNVYSLLKSAGLVHMLEKKRKKRKWVRWERKHSLSLWQTDWTQFNGKYLMVIIDDASRLVVGWGLFSNATSENSVKVLKEAISKHGKPKAMLTGHDIQFYAPAQKDGRCRGRTVFERFMELNGIEHVLARVNHPQTCGKIERFFGEVKTRINRRHDFSTVEDVIGWHNEIKPHMSLNFDELETPARAFVRKMHHRTKVIKTYEEVEVV